MNHRRALLLAKAAPKLDLNFVDGSPFDGRITFTRASGATYFDATGTLQTAATNAARIDYNPSTLAVNGLLIEEQRTNGIRNPRGEGATVGVMGSGGVAPTNWTVATASGLTGQIIGVGTESGIPYVDVRWSGTTSAALTGATLCTPEGTTAITASNGQTWAQAFYVRLVGGSFTNVTSLQDIIGIRQAGGSFLADSTPQTFTPSAAPLASQRVVATTTINNASAASIFPKIVNITAASGVAIDFTLRIGCPQLELGAFATSLILPAVGTPAATTRATELALITGQSLSMLPATLAAEVIYGQQNSSISPVAMQIGDTGGLNRILIFNGVGGASASALLTVASTNVATASASGLTFGAVSKQAASYQSSAVNEALNGTLATAVVPSATPITNADRLILGSNGATALGGYIRRVRYWPRALSTSELQTVTT